MAVLAVVLSHAEVPYLAGGYVGVDVFFVISGFLITSLLVRELEATGRFSIGRFYARRAVRLLPASTLVMLATLVGSYLWLPPVRFAGFTGDAVASAFYSINFRLAIEGTDYLRQTISPSPFQHFWSLAVEEQFYLVWPLLLLATWLLGKRRFLAVPLVAICAVSLLLSITETSRSASWAYYGSHTRIGELGAGALLSVAAARLTRLNGPSATALTWLGLGGIVASALLYDNSTAFPGYHALLPVLSTVAVIAGGFSPQRWDARLVLGLRPMQWIGGRSYSWYLWHWPLLVIGPAALGRAPSLGLALALGAAGLVLADATHRLVENPVRFHPSLKGRPGRGIALGLSLAAGTTAIALLMAADPPSVPLGQSAENVVADLGQGPAAAAHLRTELDAPLTSIPSNLIPPLDKVMAERSPIFRDGCHVGYEPSKVQVCTYGDVQSDKVVVLFGDSHAAQWFPAMQRIALAEHWRLVSVTKSSCKISDVPILIDGRPYEACTKWRATALPMIKALHPALILMSSSEAAKLPTGQKDPRKAWRQGTGRTIAAISGPNTKIAVLLDTPWPKGNVPECLTQHPRDPMECGNRLPAAINDQSRRAAETDAAARAHVKVIDPDPWFCGESGSCPPIVGNVLVYQDDSHITIQMADGLAPLLLGELPKF